MNATFFVLPLFVVLSILATWPLAARFAEGIPSSRVVFDPGLQAFLIGWGWHALGIDPLRVFDAPIFHPEPRTLTYMDHMLGEAVAAGPILSATGSLAAGYNALVLASFALSGLWTYRLVRLIGVSRTGSFLSGFLFAFGSYRFANLDLLNQLQTQFLPLGLFFAIRYLTRWKLRDLVGLASTQAVQVAFGWYYAYYLLLAVLLLAGYAAAGGLWRPPRAQAARLFVVGGLSLLAILPITWPYFVQNRAMPEFRRTLGESALYSADVLDYGRIHPTATLSSWIDLPSGPQAYFPGIVTVALSLAALIALWREVRRDPIDSSPGLARTAGLARLAERARAAIVAVRYRGYFVALAVVSFVLSLGPILHVGGRTIWIPLPYAVVYYLIPGFSSMRAPARLAVLVLLAMSVLAGLGFMELQRALARRSAGSRRSAVGALFGVAALFAWNRPVSLLTLPTTETAPPIYRWLAAQPDSVRVVEFPVPATDADETETHSLRQVLTLIHGKRRLDGSSGFVTPRYREFRSRVHGFPDPVALDEIRAMEGTLVIVHFGDYDEVRRSDLARRIAAQPRLVPKAAFGSDAAFELRP
ncbi:MAG TPA: hypothetical protein VFP58_09490 [Candidatus Eisenbacteria bacterium]|nr:hypothetical protein [Candidatus Eisenbacteria bacterium]